MSDELWEPTAVTYVEPYPEELPLFDECPVCLGEHDEEIHAATLSVRAWFRDEVTKSFRIQPQMLI